MPKDISSPHKGLMTTWPHNHGKFTVELVNHWSGLFKVSNCADICGAQSVGYKKPLLSYWFRFKQGSLGVVCRGMAGSEFESSKVPGLETRG